MVAVTIVEVGATAFVAVPNSIEEVYLGGQAVLV